MRLITWAFYSVLVVTYLASAGFIVFHILRYSLCRTNAIFGASFFLVVFILLFFMNISLFSNLPFDALIGDKLIFPRPGSF